MAALSPLLERAHARETSVETGETHTDTHVRAPPRCERRWTLTGARNGKGVAIDYITLVKPARGLYIYVDALTCVPIYTHARGGRAGRGCPLRGAVQRACTNDQSAATAAWLASARSSSV